MIFMYAEECLVASLLLDLGVPRGAPGVQPTSRPAVLNSL